jgi:hypothetical protein
MVMVVTQTVNLCDVARFPKSWRVSVIIVSVSHGHQKYLQSFNLQ